MTKMIQNSQRSLKRHFRAIGIIGVVCSWITLAFVWLDFAAASYVSYCLTGGIFGLAIFAGKN